MSTFFWTQISSKFHPIFPCLCANVPELLRIIFGKVCSKPVQEILGKLNSWPTRTQSKRTNLLVTLWSLIFFFIKRSHLPMRSFVCYFMYNVKIFPYEELIYSHLECLAGKWAKLTSVRCTSNKYFLYIKIKI